METKELAKAALDSKNLSYSPYSKFRVGAALLTEDGKIYQGANVENAVYGETVCAERIAIFNAMMQGERSFSAIAIAGDAKDFTPPCGSCRQVMLELCGPDLDVVLVKNNEDTKSFKLSELIPYSFGDKHLGL